MASKFAGQCLIAVNGIPVLHCKSVRERAQTNRESVQGMSPTGTSIGYVEGTTKYMLDIEAYVPVSGDIPWESITDAVVLIQEKSGGEPRALYSGVFVTEFERSFQETGAATVRVSAEALVKVGL